MTLPNILRSFFDFGPNKSRNSTFQAPGPQPPSPQSPIPVTTFRMNEPLNYNYECQLLYLHLLQALFPHLRLF
ncbi:8b8cf0aa-085f-452e-9c5e-a8260289344c [Sclerotinia trifoliorum]|uniref:8b8cf0aa-085f-452e-9c5e-a8260289344c n=1 Tax=Sclerotinia trifoliorum TaxID=28548 RepID=A0A8H2VMX8_9HELO|nr:8b8cf0aa-085f-452e-9c5e-a8260289344c [Sclerotinia trifoliorum]